MIKNYLKIFGLIYIYIYIGVYDSFCLTQIFTTVYDKDVIKVTSASKTTLNGDGTLAHAFAALIPSQIESEILSAIYRVIIDRYKNGMLDLNFVPPIYKNRMFFDMATTPEGDIYYAAGGVGVNGTEGSFLTSIDSKGKILWSKIDTTAHKPILKSKLDPSSQTLTNARIADDKSGVLVSQNFAKNGDVVYSYGPSGTGNVFIAIQNWDPGVGIDIKLQNMSNGSTVAQGVHAFLTSYVINPANSKPQVRLDRIAYNGKSYDTAFYDLPTDVSFSSLHISFSEDQISAQPLTITGSGITGDRAITIAFQVNPATLEQDLSYGDRGGFATLDTGFSADQLIAIGSAKTQGASILNGSKSHKLQLAKFDETGKVDRNVGMGDGKVIIAEGFDGAALTSFAFINYDECKSCLKHNSSDTTPCFCQTCPCTLVQSQQIATANTVSIPGQPALSSNTTNEPTAGPLNKPATFLIKIIPDSQLSPIVIATLKKYCGAV